MFFRVIIFYIHIYEERAERDCGLLFDVVVSLQRQTSDGEGHHYFIFDEAM